MHFNSLEQILNQLEQQPGWEKFRDYRQLLTCWQNTVNSNIAQHARPLSIERQVLWVATSSAARAQEFSFQRYSLLKKLNQQLPFILKDIRFSSSHWYQITEGDHTQKILFKTSSQKKYPIKSSNSSEKAKKLEPNLEKFQPAIPLATEAVVAAKRYLSTLQQNSNTLISCPNCDSPTPIKEIERWNLCHHCIAQQWSQEYRPTTFPESK